MSTVHHNAAVQIVSSVFQSRSASPSEVIAMFREVYKASKELDEPEKVQSAELVKAEVTPAVPIKKSVTNDAIICLHDGKKFKSLKRHLMSVYNQTPDQYREQFGLPVSYPMVAPAYAAARSELAKKMGLGKIHAKG